MRKSLITILVAVAILFFAWTYVKGEIEVDVTPEDLPQDIYGDPGDLLTTANFQLLQIVNPLSLEDEYTLTEKFMNYMMYYSIRENVNSSYDPLNEECEEVECHVITSTTFGDVEYAYMKLNEFNQLVLTINFNRTEFLSFETAIIAIFDIDVSIVDMELTVTLHEMFLNDIVIEEDRIDWVLEKMDAKAIEDSIAIGNLDLEDKVYSVGLFNVFE